MSQSLIPFLKCLKNYNGKSYFSETGEDLALSQIFKEPFGHYLDIGAQHPIFGSNTYFFYRKGWSGIAIEPQERFNVLWKIFRRRDKFFNLLIGNSNLPVEFAEFENSLLSSADQDTILKHINNGKIPDYKTFQPVSLSSLLAKKIEPEDPFFISIDVEGMELKVLKGIDFNIFNFKYLLVECVSNEKYLKISSFLFKKKYIHIDSLTPWDHLFKFKNINNQRRDK